MSLAALSRRLVLRLQRFHCSMYVDTCPLCEAWKAQRGRCPDDCPGCRREATIDEPVPGSLPREHLGVYLPAMKYGGEPLLLTFSEPEVGLGHRVRVWLGHHDDAMPADQVTYNPQRVSSRDGIQLEVLDVLGARLLNDPARRLIPDDRVRSAVRVRAVAHVAGVEKPSSFQFFGHMLRRLRLGSPRGRGTGDRDSNGTECR